MDNEINTCEGVKGGNTCGRQHEFIITDKISFISYFSCVDCVGRLIILHDLDSVEVDRIYD